MNTDVPVICIDGPSGAGKGTLSGALAKELGWKLLDSGALYRLLAYAAGNHGIGLDNEEGLEALAAHLDVQFIASGPGEPQKIILEGDDVSRLIRNETIASGASKVSAIPVVRAALLQRQREFLELPGLIADGRDMGTVVFPNAPLKVYLTASAEERARRRVEQLRASGQKSLMEAVLADIQERDTRDSSRATAPLKPADDAIVIDSTHLTIEQVLDRIKGEIGCLELMGRM